MASKQGKSVDLGAAQGEFEVSQRDWQASERALARAQDDRDKKLAKFRTADVALRDAARMVLG